MPNWKKVVTSGSNPELNNITASGVIDIKGTSAHLPPDGAIRLAYNSDKLSVNSEHGYVRLGVVAGDSVKFFTDGDDYHFDESVVVDGGVFASKDEDLILRRDFDDTTYNQIKIADDSYELKLDNTVRHSIDGVGNNTFSGNITSSGLHTTGNISASGFVSASSFSGDGAGLTNVSATVSGDTFATDLKVGRDSHNHLDFTTDNQIKFRLNNVDSEFLMLENVFRPGGNGGAVLGTDGKAFSDIVSQNANIQGSITASGNIQADGNISASGDTHKFGGKIELGTRLNVDSIDELTDGAGTKFESNITASGNISSSGDVLADQFFSNGLLALDINGTNTRLGVNSTTTGIVLGKAGTNTSITATGNITASGNISASGTITANTTTETGLDKLVTYDTSTGQFHITASSAFMGSGGGGGAVSAVANGSNNRLATFSSGDALNGEANLTFDGSTLGVTGNQTISSHITASGNISGSSTSTIIVGGDITTNDNFLLNTNNTGIYQKNAAGALRKVINYNASDVLEIGSAANTSINLDQDTEVSGHITASGDISASGTIESTGNISTDGDFKGMTATSQLLVGHQTAEAAYVKAQISHHQDAGAPVAMDFLKSRGTLASPTTLQQGDFTGTQRYFGHDGSSYRVSAAIRGDIDSGATVGTNVMPGALNFLTTTNGSLNSRLFITSTGNVGIGKTAPTKLLEVAGDISASGDLVIGNIESNTYISASNGTLEISGSGRGQLEVDYRLFDTGSTHLSTAGGAQGDIVKFGGSSTTAGDIYYLQPAGTWAQARANAVGTSTGSVAVALGTNSTNDGMLLKGMVKLDNDPSATIGNPVYLDDGTAGHARNTAPDTSGDIVRIVGHYYSGSGLIYFNPDNTFIEVA